MTSLAVANRSFAGRATMSSLTERLFAFLERSHARACAALLALSLACFLPGFVSLQPMDRDEPRFAQASKQMLETGDFVDIRFQDEARHKKPVGIHWLQSAAVASAEALGLPEARTAIAAYRLPSLIGAVAMVLLTYWAALAFTGRREALIAAAFIAASVILMVEARLAKTDAVLGACSVAAMGALARAYLARGVARLPFSTVLIFWVAIGFGILIKGPMIVMFAGLCALALSIRERSARWLAPLRPWLGLAIVLLFTAPWFIAIAVKSGGAFYSAAIGDDLLGKVGTGQQSHWGPPGYYLVAFFATAWPMAAFTAMAIPFMWRSRADDAIAFLIAWIAPSWVLFEAFSTKLPHYVMPLYAALAVATVMAMSRGEVGPHRRGAKAVALLIPFIPIGLTLGLVAAAWHLGDPLPLAALPVLGAASLVAVLAWVSFSRANIAEASLAGIASSALIAIGVLGLAQPLLHALKLSPRLAEVARSLDCPQPRIGTLGYREPSLVFLTRTDLRMLNNAAEAALFLSEGGCGVVFVESRHEAGFRAEIDRRGLQPALKTRVAGFNINGGRRVDIGAYVSGP
jgi:4-amino-4-deoxy-L-arabinose transferase-like glycosyltransferase